MDSTPLSSVAEPGRLPGWRVRYAETTGSTNALAAADPEPGLVVVTDHQTAGRGRLDRGWETPAGVALTFSAVVDPGVPDARWPWLPLLAGLAVADVVRRVSGVDTGLKWPNDVLVGDRKLAGILLERVTHDGRPVGVVGVGLNVHQTEPPVPGATSLALEGAVADRVGLLAAVLDRLSALLADWRADGGQERLATAYADRCGTLGADVRVLLPGDRSLTGRAEAVDEQGRLVVRDAAGRHPLAAGDVVHVRRS